MAHLFCELYYRARSAGLEKTGSLHLPFHQAQLGDALGMSLVTVNRTLQALRRTGAMEFRNGVLTVRDWKRLPLRLQVRASKRDLVKLNQP
jgi:transcription initiation factor IIE alpha subunit